MADTASGADLRDHGQDQVLGRHAEGQAPGHRDRHEGRPGLGQGLGGQHVLDLAGADAERQRAEGAVGGGVGVPAHDRHAGLRDPELGADHVHDPLALGAERVDRHAELRAVALERKHLLARENVLDARRRGGAVGGRVVIGGGEGAVGAAHRTPGQAQPVEGLRAGDLVHQVQVHVQQPARDLVRLPDLLEHGLGHQLRLKPAASTARNTAFSPVGFSKW